MERTQAGRRIAAYAGKHDRARFAPRRLLLGVLYGMLSLGAAAHAHGSGMPAPGASEDDLRSIWARGLPEDRLFDLRSLYLGNGMAVEAFAGGARLLNPPPGLADAFRNVRFNPADLSVIVDRSGAGLVRLSGYIADAEAESLRPKGAGPSFGSVHLHDIDLRGTLVRVMRTR